MAKSKATPNHEPEPAAAAPAAPPADPESEKKAKPEKKASLIHVWFQNGPDATHKLLVAVCATKDAVERFTDSAMKFATTNKAAVWLDDHAPEWASDLESIAWRGPSGQPAVRQQDGTLVDLMTSKPVEPEA